MSDVPNSLIPSFKLTEARAGGILTALREVGCVVLDDVIPARATMHVFEAARHAFALPDLASRCPYDPELEWGYSPHGAERVRGGEPEVSRCFLDLMPEGNFTGDMLVDRPLRLFANELNNFCDSFVRLFFPKELGIDELQARRRRLRLTSYKTGVMDSQCVLMGEHRDPNLFTMHVGGAQPGLQVKIKDTWVSVDIDADCVLIGAGTILRHYVTRVESLWHRVVAASYSRTSVSLFVGPDPGVQFPNGERASEFYKRMRDLIRA